MSHLYSNEVDGQLFNCLQKGRLSYAKLNRIQGRTTQAITDAWERLIWWLSYEGWQITLSIERFALLRRMLYANEELLYQGEVGKLATRPIPRQWVREAILDGRLFAFRFPGRSTRQWGVPKSVAAFWAGDYIT